MTTDTDRATANDVERLKAKLLNSLWIDWDAINKIYAYAAMDRNGEWYAYSSPPALASSSEWGNHLATNWGRIPAEVIDGEPPDWEDSLQKRPI